MPGTSIPGIVITAGTYYWAGQCAFWNVRDRKRAIEIELTGNRFSRLVVEVADPQATIAQIERAVEAARSRFTR